MRAFIAGFYTALLAMLTFLATLAVLGLLADANAQQVCSVYQNVIRCWGDVRQPDTICSVYNGVVRCQ